MSSDPPRAFAHLGDKLDLRWSEESEKQEAVLGWSCPVATWATVHRAQRVCGILTGHVLKDPDAVVGYHRGTLEGIVSNFANAPVSVDATTVAVTRAIRED